MNIIDVRAQMPNYEQYKNWQRSGDITGIAIHHSATANRETGAPTGDAFSFFDYQVHGRGWTHGGYNYVVLGDGRIQYALDENIAAYHAGFKDPTDAQGLEQGQYWNNHYLAICLAGWFSENRTYSTADGTTQPIPNDFTRPTAAQWEALLALLKYLLTKYHIPVENVRGHRELRGNHTQCPGLNFDPAQLRQKLEGLSPASPPAPTPNPGEHVLLFTDTGDTFSAALSYIWKFQPDVSFAPHTAASKWLYYTAVGNISADLLSEYQQQGAKLVQHVAGSLDTIQQQLDALVAQNQRFLPPTASEPDADQLARYTVQPGDTLSRIALQFYGKASLWPVIFAANRDTLADPGRLRVGQELIVPAQARE